MIDDLLSKILDDLDHVRRAAGALMAQTAQRKMDRDTIMASTDRANGCAQMAIMRIGQVSDCVRTMTGRIAELESLVARLADMMRRGDMEEFTSEVKPVTSAEWFGALHEAEALLSERDQSEHPLGMGGDHLRDATKMVEQQARIAALEAAIEAQRRKLSSITDQIAALYLIADAAGAALDDARIALDEALENDD